MKKKKRNNKTITILIILVILFVISLNYKLPIKELEKLLNNPLTSINKIFIYKKNENQTESYLIQKNLNLVLTKEVEELKKILDLNTTHSTFENINSTVISRNQSYWLNTIIIDKGENQGITENMAVITTEGLIGQISKVSKATSEVKLLTTNDSKYKTSVIIQTENEDIHAILNGYNEENKLLRVITIDKNIQVKKGDIVSTSGIGNMPKGLYIGTVEKTEIDKYNLSQIIYVKSKENYNNINYVTILKEKK